MQRFGSGLQLNLHFHALVPDDVFTASGFHLAPPEGEEVDELLRVVARRVLRLLRRRGRLDADEYVDALGSLQAASPPRVHLTRFHGVFAPAARRRMLPADPPPLGRARDPPRQAWLG